MKRLAYVSGCAVVAVAACFGAERAVRAAAPARTPTGSARATLWVQTAAEYRAGTTQAYRLATRLLDEALRDPCWTADVAQQLGGGYACKPPAVVLDADETVLDNGALQARLLLAALADPAKDDEFDVAAWDAWVAERRAAAVPGVAAFLAQAVARGVTPFIVTNRSDAEHAATVDNLRALGLPFDAARVLTKHEAAGRPNDKTSRRAAIAARYRILLLCGDDLNDFVSGFLEGGPADRARAYAAHEAWVGTRWIVLPNPVYGSWRQALGATPEQFLRPE